MKVLIVCSGNAPDFKFEINQAFVYDQVKAISREFPEIYFDYFFIIGKGICGYFSNLRRLQRLIRSQHFDVIHAHVAYAGLLANFQRRVPVVCTFHGSDINLMKTRCISALVTMLSQKVIYVSRKLYSRAFIKGQHIIIPCGVDIAIFRPVDKVMAREQMHLNLKKKYILFSSSFGDKNKNFNLLKKACDLIQDNNIEIIELKGFTREEVCFLMNSSDLCILTSFREGSSQFIKEAMACNCPIVSTDVGDVREVLEKTEGCYITDFDSPSVAEKLTKALEYSKSKGYTNGRQRIIDMELTSGQIAKRIVEVYKLCLSA